MADNDMPKTDADWRERLTPEQFRVLRQKGTERAFSGAYFDTKTPGVYACAGCGEPLFDARGYTTDYLEVPLDDRRRALFREGRNTLAVTCRQSRGGQGIDVGLSLEKGAP